MASLDKRVSNQAERGSQVLERIEALQEAEAERNAKIEAQIAERAAEFGDMVEHGTSQFVGGGVGRHLSPDV